MEPQELRNLQEAYVDVYNPERLDEISDRRDAKKNNANEEVDIYDIILSHLLDEGYADTYEAAEVLMVNMSEDWRESILEEYVDEAITSEKGKAKAAEMIAARSTASGRAKAGQGSTVAAIKKIRGSGIQNSDKEGLAGTPMTPTMARNPVKKMNYTGTGNKAARRASGLGESFNIFVNTMISEGVSLDNYTWEEIQNVFNDLFESQYARENPEKYERDAKKGQSREQQLKSRVTGRLAQMDPEKRKKMEAMMRAQGL